MGLLEQGTAPDQPMPAQQPPAGAGPGASMTDQGGGEQSPQRQVLEVAKAAAKEMIFGEDHSHKGVLAALKSKGDPVQNIATLAARLTIKIDQQMGNKIPDGVILPLGAAVLGYLDELGDAAGTGGLADQNQQRRAVSVMAKQLGEHYGSGQQAKGFLQRAGEASVRNAMDAMGGQGGPAAAEEQSEPAGGGLLSGGASDGAVE